jgi:hypothetical protein
VTWNRDGSDLTGSVVEALRDDDELSVSSDRRSFTGRVDGSGVSITLAQGLGETSTLTGSVHGDKLDLDLPGDTGGITTVHLHSAVPDDFNRALAALRADVGRKRAAREQAQQDAEARDNAQKLATAVANDLSALRDTANNAQTGGSSISDDLKAVNDDLDVIRKETKTVLDEAGSTDSGAVCSDAGTVEANVGTLESDIGTIESDQCTTEGDAAPVAATTKELRDDFAALQAIDPFYVPGYAPGAAQVNAAIRAARKKVGGATAFGQSVKQQANAIHKQALSYEKRADDACNRAAD